MPRYINFGDNGDIAVLSVFYNFLYLLLNVVSAIGFAVELMGFIFEQMPDKRFFTHWTYLSKARIFFDFYTPPLVIGEVPMELIEVMKCEYINVLLDKIYCKEMPAHIKMHSPIGKARRIVYHSGRER